MLVSRYCVDLRLLLKRQLPVLGVFALLIPVWTLVLHGGVCIEGGTVVGFPWLFYDQCYGPFLPGGGQAVDPAHFEPLLLVLDSVFWYVVASVLVLLVRRAAGR